MRRLIAVLSVVILCIFSLAPQTPAFGPSVGAGGKRETTEGKERVKELQRSREKRKARGKREERRREERLARALRLAARRALSGRREAAFRTAVSLPEVLYAVVAELEREGVSPFKECRLVTDPPKLSDLGISFEVSPGVIDLVAKEYYESQAAAGGAVEGLDREALERVADCALKYAEILGSASLALKEFVREVGEDWLGYEDLLRYARRAVLSAANDPAPGVRETVSAARRVFTPRCRFRGRMEVLQCGGLLLELRPLFSLRLGSLELYGSRFAGVGGEWTVSAGWSLEKAWERLVSDERVRDLVKGYADYVERVEARGEALRAAMLKKKALLAAKEGRWDIVLSPTP